MGAKGSHMHVWRLQVWLWKFSSLLCREKLWPAAPLQIVQTSWFRMEWKEEDNMKPPNPETQSWLKHWWAATWSLMSKQGSQGEGGNWEGSPESVPAVVQGLGWQRESHHQLKQSWWYHCRAAAAWQLMIPLATQKRLLLLVTAKRTGR